MADKISITICGDGGCGKSSITLRIVRSEWMHEYDPTIEDSYSVTRTVDGVPYFLSITDTAGQEEYRGLWAASNLKSDAFLLVYDITSAPTLHALDYFMEMIDIEAEQREENNYRLRQELGSSAKGLDVGMPPPIKIVAGNKCDLKESRAVPARDGLEYARKHGCGFMETSAREMVNIEETFALIVRRVVEARRLHYGHASSDTQQLESSSSPTPTLTAGEKETGDKSSKRAGRRHGHFLCFGKRMRRSRDADATEKANPNHSAAERESETLEDNNNNNNPKGFWRRLRCW